MTRQQYHSSQVSSAKQFNLPSRHHHLILLVIALIVIIYLGYGIKSGFQFDHQSYNPQNQSTSAQSRLSNHQPISVLMMGTDTGALGRHSKGRTDTMILDTVNPDQQKMTLTSIPRDAPARYGNILTKINSIYTLGGADQTERYVQDWLGVPVNYYVLINMGGLTNIINKVGGVSVNPPLTFKYGAANVKKHTPVVLNGKQALDYCRMRHHDPLGDYGRQIRQRQVLFQLFDKLTKVHNLVLHPGLVRELSRNLKTNLSTRDLITLATFYRAANRHHVSNHLQGRTKVINGQDFEAIPPGEKQRETELINRSLN